MILFRERKSICVIFEEWLLIDRNEWQGMPEESVKLTRHEWFRRGSSFFTLNGAEVNWVSHRMILSIFNDSVELTTIWMSQLHLRSADAWQNLILFSDSMKIMFVSKEKEKLEMPSLLLYLYGWDFNQIISQSCHWHC